MKGFGSAGGGGKLSPHQFTSPWEYLMEVAKQKPGTAAIEFLGDSLTAPLLSYAHHLGYYLQNYRGYPGFNYAKLGYSGYRVTDVFNYAHWFQTFNDYPDTQVFTILLGTNDTKPENEQDWGHPIGYTKYGYERLIGKILQERPNALIRIMQIPWVSPDTTDATFLPNVDWEAKKDAVNALIKVIARRYGMPEPFDLYALTKDKTSWYELDGLHFNAVGGRHLAAAFETHLRKPKPAYTANRHFLVGKPYTIAGTGVISGSFNDPAGDKLCRGTIQPDVNKVINQIGFNQLDNGGSGQTISPMVEFLFGDEAVTLNDVHCVVGGVDDYWLYRYSPNSVKFYKTDNGTDWAELATLTAASEGWTDYGFDVLYGCAHYTPAAPFTTKGLRVEYTKEYGLGPSSDWLFIGEISATALTNWS